MDYVDGGNGNIIVTHAGKPVAVILSEGEHLCENCYRRPAEHTLYIPDEPDGENRPFSTGNTKRGCNTIPC